MVVNKNQRKTNKLQNKINVEVVYVKLKLPKFYGCKINKIGNYEIYKNVNFGSFKISDTLFSTIPIILV